ncbi:hypothetical protein A3A03_00805 [Candidatus Nomurabacteria bacterium RIFCSPLOWO2_01_FULL_40_18]|uniref:Uncharacterized protein n=1 Tax=Candidatus Nomurabacteria bacterium RIFCSPLOWO2_01_FULL_40_18 TaxID=1801773 RepID=A0A1F6XHL5_9BACT|nr:MAG: hypothetical protein A3A03_00805 [Candidatus Nomurabacteria bacterium RIFCSPLOWO2_01_FULL_40_18]
MVTPELIQYIKAEFAKGRTREEVHNDLVKNGGWSEVDLNEGFRSVIPMQSIMQSPVTMQSSSYSKSPAWFPKIILIVIILGGIFWAGWFLRAPLMKLFNPEVNKTDNTASVLNNPVIANTAIVKDCGIGTTPDLKNPLTYQNDAVLACLGNSALRCENAKANLNDALFPTNFQIIKNEDGQSCNFKLSYKPDSTLVDATGQKLAGQYISCPISIVKVLDETKSTPSFSAPSTENLGKYASQIYFYGTLGLFMETNVNKSQIQSLGCSGPYIDTVIASYNNR